MRQRLMKMRPITLVFIVAIIVRLGVFAIVCQSAMNSPDPFMSRVFNNPDSVGYAQLGQNIIERGVFSQDIAEPFAPDLIRTPAYPLFLGGLYVIAGHRHDPVLILFVQVIISLANLWLAIKIGEKLVSCQVGLIAGGFYAIAPATLIYIGLAVTETLFTLFLLAGIYLLILGVEVEERCTAVGILDSFRHRLKGDRWRYIILAGLLFALAAYTRPIALYFLPLLALGFVVVCWRKRRTLETAAVMLVIYALTLAPWYLRNLYHFGTPLFSSIGDENLLIYNVASIEAQRQGITWREAKDQLWAELHTRMGEIDQPTVADNSRLMRQIALDHIFAHPIQALFYQSLDALNSFRPGYSMSMLLLRDETDFGNEIQSGNLDVLLQTSLTERILFIFMTLYYGVFYVAVTVGGLVVLVRRQWNILLLVGLTAAWFLYLPGSAGNARFRVPVEGLLAVFAAIGMVWMWVKIRPLVSALSSAAS